MAPHYSSYVVQTGIITTCGLMRAWIQYKVHLHIKLLWVNKMLRCKTISIFTLPPVFFFFFFPLLLTSELSSFCSNGVDAIVAGMGSIEWGTYDHVAMSLIHILPQTENYLSCFIARRGHPFFACCNFTSQALLPASIMNVMLFEVHLHFLIRERATW